MSAFRILVADDNGDCAESLARILRILGHEVRTADCGPAVLREAARYHPDLILLDIGMPGMSGFEVVQQLRHNADTREATIIAVSGWSTAECRQRAAEEGFDGYLTKPVSLETLEHLLPATASACRLTSSPPAESSVR